MILGIDVSKWNGDIDWGLVAAYGVKFAMIRAATGSWDGATIKKDPTFAANVIGATNAGIKIGVYLYSYARSPEAARGEADLLLPFIEPYRNLISYPVVYDIEEKGQAALGKSVCTAMCNEFCDRIRGAGFLPMVYANQGWLKDYLYTDEIRADIWLALWKKSDTYPGSHTMWQYSASGSVPGINGDVDMDFAYKDYAALVDDIPSDWALPAFEWATRNGIVKGDGEGHYGLKDPPTLERLVVFLYRMYNLLATDDGK